MMITPQQFSTSIRSLFPNGLPSKLAIALSGGVDSMCLTYLVSQYLKNQGMSPASVLAITIDHKLRKESSQEAQAIGKYVTNTFGVKHLSYPLQWPKGYDTSSNNFEHSARILRYRAIRDICGEKDITNLLTGHTRDDNIETYILRSLREPRNPYFSEDSRSYGRYLANRVFGQCGIKSQSKFPLRDNAPPPSFNKIMVTRPLLEFSKSDLMETCKNENIRWFEDPTNVDPEITERNKIRNDLKEMQPEVRKEKEQQILGRIQRSNGLVDNYHHEKNMIHEFLKQNYWITKNREISSISMKIPSDILFHSTSPALNRLFFDLLESISPSTDYHYKFLKLSNLSEDLMSSALSFEAEGVISPSEFLNMSFKYKKSSKRLSLTQEQKLDETFGYINCRHNRGTLVEIEISRQKMSRNDIQREHKCLAVLEEWSDHWIDYDNRFYFKFKENKRDDSGYYPNYVIRPFEIRQDKGRIKNQWGTKKSEGKNVDITDAVCKMANKYSIPILENIKTGQVIGFPPLYMHEPVLKELGLEWQVGYRE
ncbi:hypothetical protein DASC09_006940 [Saccharomycopsis crataegensis]|uniref:tRNA(Ile)-lysidine synthetase n=1 Tax=Saccharomycopsis crataegensis TaxID=43959 RepID=A0AAV5QF57_9ASCO|nr:hypothetical protein DASC09_006940 [Saccharomycopsis crataegensis]